MGVKLVTRMVPPAGSHQAPGGALEPWKLAICGLLELGRKDSHRFGYY